MVLLSSIETNVFIILTSNWIKCVCMPCFIPFPNFPSYAMLDKYHDLNGEMVLFYLCQQIPLARD